MNPMFDMTGRTALVTGATRGIGRAIVDQYVLQGARVVVNSRRAADCEAVAEALNDKAGRDAAWPCAFDFADPAAIRDGVDRAVAHWGRLDTVVGNAYVTAIGTEGELDPAVFADTLRINVVHNSILVQRAVPALRASGNGVVIFISSVSGLIPSPSVAAYGISKRALLHMMQNLAVEWGHDGIRVNAVVPGIIRTPTTESYWRDEQALAERVADWPLRRIGEPEEIAAACLFLAAPAGRFTTGHALVSDGGRSLVGASAETGAVPADFKLP